MIKKIAVCADEGLLVDALLNVWENTEFLQDYVPFLLSERSAGNTAVFNNRGIVFHDYQAAEDEQFALVMLLNTDDAVQDFLKKVSCNVIGTGAAFAHLSLQAPLYCGQQSQFLQIPDAASLAMQQLLTAPCRSIAATLFMPASMYGQAGVEELASQTVSLLNAKAVKSRVFSQQLSFNCFAFADISLQQRLLSEWQTLLQSDVQQLAIIQAPTFHGVMLQLMLEFVDVAAAKAQLAAWSEQFAEPDSENSVMSAVQHDGELQLTVLEQHAGHPQFVQINVCFDDIQLFVRQGLISASEFLLKHDL